MAVITYAAVPIGPLIDTAKKKVPRLDPNPTSYYNAPLSTTSPVKMVKRKLGALEKVEADL
jgi:hypothetical protein